VVCLPAALSQAEDKPSPGIRLHDVVLPVTDVQQAISWYSKNAGAVPSTYLHRPAVAFSDGTYLLFDPKPSLAPKSQTVMEIELATLPTTADGSNPKPRQLTDPWGVRVDLRPAGASHGLTRVVVRTKDTAKFVRGVIGLGGAKNRDNDEDGLSFPQFYLPIEPEEAPADATPAPIRIGFRTDSLEGLAARLTAAGATEMLGPARFEGVHILEATLCPGLRVQIAADPPADTE